MATIEEKHMVLKSLKLILIFIFFQIFFLRGEVLFACNPEPGPLHFPRLKIQMPKRKIGYFESFTVLDGLPTNRINFVKAIEKRVLAGTSAGLVVFEKSGNGWVFKVCNSKELLPSPVILSACGPDKFGNIFIGTNRGLTVIDKDFESQTELLTTADGLPSNTIQSLYMDKYGKVVVGTDRGAVVIENSNIARLKSSEEKLNILSINGKKDNAIFGTATGSFFMESGNDLLDPITPTKDFPWNAAIEFFNKKLYIGSVNGLLVLKNGNLYKVLTKKDGLPSNWITALAVAKEHFSPSSDPIGEFFKRGKSYATAGELERYTEISNLIKQFQKEVKKFLELKGTIKEIRAAYQKLVVKKRAIELLIENFLSFKSKNKELWVGTEHSGLALYNNKKWHKFNTKNSRLTSDKIVSIATACDNSVFIATKDGGVNRFGKVSVNVRLKGFKKPILRSEITALLGYGNFVFAGTKSDGLYKINLRKNYAVIKVKSKGKYGLKSKQITALACNGKGTFFIGTADKGIFITEDMRTFYNYNKKHGLADNHVTTIFIDKYDRVFAGCKSSSTFVGDKLSIFNGDSFFTFSRENILKLRKAAELKNKKKLTKLLIRLKGLVKSLKFEKNSNINRAVSYRKSSNISLVQNVNIIYSIAATDWYIILGTDKGPVIFDGTHFLSARSTGKFSSGEIRDIVVTESQKIYMATDYGLLKHDGKGWIICGVPMEFKTFKLNALTLDDVDPENVWFVAGDDVSGGIGAFNGRMHGKAIPYSGTVILIETPNVWIGTKRALFRLTKER